MALRSTPLARSAAAQLRRARCPAAAAAARASGRAGVEVACDARGSAVASLRLAAGAVLTNVLLASPALAEPGKIFDFNATLPLMAAQFLALMLVLDKLVYSPVGAVLDSRDAELRAKLESVRDASGDLTAFTEEANGLLASARKDAADEMAKAKASADAEVAAKIAAAKAKLDAELKSSLAALEASRAESYKQLDKEVDKLSDTIVKKVLATA